MNKVMPLLTLSFRLFFLLTALIASLNPVLWVCTYLGYFSFPLINVDPLFWHGHEMLFGFTGALIAGFILTASANWTKSKPFQGRALLLLAFVWAIERVSYFLPVNIYIQFILMNLFFPTLTIMLLKKLWNFRKQKIVFIPIILGLTIGKILYSWGHLFSIYPYENFGKQLSVGLIRLIILLIAGRVVPFFTRKKIKGIEINIPNWLNLLSLFPIILLAVPLPEETARIIFVVLLIWAVIANFIRQLMWKPWATINIPILFILHLGVAFINIGLLMKLYSLFNDQFNSAQAVLHMLLAGGLGLLSIGMMTRVSLGHTGRIIKADFITKSAYFFIFIGAFVRVFIPIFFEDYYELSLHFASISWSLGFFIFIFKYFKILITTRVGIE